VKGETGVFPVESAEFNQPPHFGFSVADQIFVADGQKLQRQCPPPMCHQPLKVIVVAGERAQIVGETDFIRKTGEVAGQAYVQRLAFERDDPRVRKQRGNETEMQEVERQLVGYSGSADINANRSSPSISARAVPSA